MFLVFYQNTLLKIWQNFTTKFVTLPLNTFYFTFINFMLDILPVSSKLRKKCFVFMNFLISYNKFTRNFLRHLKLIKPNFYILYLMYNRMFIKTCSITHFVSQYSECFHQKRMEKWVLKIYWISVQPYLENVP